VSVPRATIVEACESPQLFGVALYPKQRELLEAVDAASHRIHAWALGRRSGKTTMAAICCLHNCVLRNDLDATVRPGERRFSVAVATNVRQARLIVAAARSIVERSPLLARFVESVSEDEIRFTNGTALAAFPCSSRGGRGWPISCLVMDEAAHFMTESDGFQTAARVWEALVPSTAQFGDRARVILASTPFGESGLFADVFAKALSGELGDAVAQHAGTAEMNPTIAAEFLAVEERRDPDGFRSEYLAEFVGSGDAYIDFERVDLAGVPVARREDAVSWVAGLDPAFSRDPFGLALVGRTADGRMVVGPVRALHPEGDFAGPLDEVGEACRAFGARVVTDQFSAAAVVDRLRREHGLRVTVNTMSATSKTAIFSELRACLYDGRLVLPDHPELIGELRRLRTKFSAGSAAIVNPRVGGSHGDMAQALALAVFELASTVVSSGVPWVGRRVSPSRIDGVDAWPISVSSSRSPFIRRRPSRHRI
jgi:hypothetical protein